MKRQRRSFFRRSEPFVDRNSFLKAILGSGQELTEKVIRERIEKVSPDVWAKDISNVASAVHDSSDSDSDSLKCFEDFVVLSCFAIVAIDKDEHLIKCLKYWPESEERKNNELVKYI